MTLTGGNEFVTSAFNDGGTSGNPIGGFFGKLFGATANSGATFYNQFIGGEDDCSYAAGSSAQRMACMQFVRSGTAHGLLEDWGVSIAATSGMNNPLIMQSATTANGVLLEVQNQGGGGSGLQSMAGGFDSTLCAATGLNNFTDGHLGSGGGGYIVRGPNSQLLGSGDMQVGYTSIHIGTGSTTIDTGYVQLTGTGTPVGGGTLWSGGLPVYDTFGNQGTVSVSAGAPTSVAIIATAFVPSGAAPSGATAVTWCPETTSLADIASSGASLAPPCFTTTETYTAARRSTLARRRRQRSI
jgi:hypothetical protein